MSLTEHRRQKLVWRLYVVRAQTLLWITTVKASFIREYYEEWAIVTHSVLFGTVPFYSVEKD